MAVIYGYKFGVSGQTNIGEWRIVSHNVVPIDLATSLTGQASVTLAGTEDWQGQCTGFGYAPSVNPGETFTFSGMLDKPGTDGVGATGPAIVVSVTVSVSYEQNGPIQWMMEFAGNGPLSYGVVTVTDSGAPTWTPACSANVLINGGVPDDLSLIVLTVQNGAIRYNAAGASCGYFRRVAGPYSAASKMEYFHNGTRPHSLGDLIRIQIGGWDVNPLRIVNVEGYGVRGRDESPPRVAYTSVFAGYTSGGTKGAIVTPNGAVW